MINIFLSYSHDSEAHRNEVVQLATKLIEMGGVDVQMDLWAGKPAEDWSTWMEQSIRKADVCLVVCSSAYYGKIMHNIDSDESGVVSWDGQVIRNLLFVENDLSTRFIPVLLSNGKPVHILSALKDAAFYRPNDPAELEKLYQAITREPAYQKPPVKPRPTPAAVSHQQSGVDHNGATTNPTPRSLVAEGKLKEALNLMAADPEFEGSNELILIQAQFHRLEQDMSLGILTHEQSSIQHNRLTYAILSMLEK